MLEFLFNKAAGLKACNSFIKRLQLRCFPVKFAKFLKIPFFTEKFQWLLLMFNSCFQRSSEQKSVRLSPKNARFSWKKIFAVEKIQKQSPYVFCKRVCFPVNVADFLRTPILKNICERLLLKISTSKTNLPKRGSSWILLSF